MGAFVFALEDILGRLMTHANVAKAAGGAEITKGGAFYGDRLGFMGDDQRARVVAWCQEHDIVARFGTMPLGGVNLTLRAVSS